jgi:hypothetical protein
MNIPLAYGDYKGRSGAANAMEMVNLMPEADAQGGAENFSLIRTPGCSEYIDLGVTGDGRGGYSYPGYTICVIRDKIYLIDHSDISSTYLGALNTISGSIQWAENPSQIMLIDGTNGHVYDKSSKSISIITDPDFPTPKACTFKDGYGVVVESDTGKFFVSAVNDFTSWDALSFTTAEYEPDNLVSCLSSHDSLFAFGEKTTQVYYNSGNSSFPFDNRPGTNMQIGCGATNSPAKGENIIFWLDQNGIVRKIDGYSQQIVSTRQIEYNISQFSTFSDARGFIYVQEGHTFYVLIFPAERVVYVYDMSTDQWHKRNSGSSEGPWRANWIVQDAGLILAGDYINGKIYKLDTSVFTDNSLPVKWTTTVQNINADRNMISHIMLEIHFEGGTGLVSGQGNDPIIWMQYSDDDGKTWSREKWGKIGKLGDYAKRVRFYNLGRSRSRIYRISGTDPTKIIIISVRLEGVILGY